jgi:hypothetical protein
LFFEIRSIELLIMKEGEVGMEHQVREPPSHVGLSVFPFFPSLFGNGVELLLPYIRRLTRPDRRHRQVGGCHPKIPKPRAAASALPRCDRPGPGEGMATKAAAAAVASCCCWPWCRSS